VLHSNASDGDFVLAAGIAMEMGIEQAPQVEWKRESDFARYLLLKTGWVCFSCEGVGRSRVDDHTHARSDAGGGGESMSR
jgi:hypothetical protein